MEPGALSQETMKTLAAMGYSFTQSPERWTYYVQAVEWDRRSNTLSGGADPRNQIGSARVVTEKAKLTP